MILDNFNGRAQTRAEYDMLWHYVMWITNKNGLLAPSLLLMVCLWLILVAGSSEFRCMVAQAGNRVVVEQMLSKGASMQVC